MLSVVGTAITVCMVVALISGRVAPVVALTVIPLAGAFVAGFGPGEISEFFDEGLASVLDVAAMLLFAILFFGVMNDAGLFRPLVNAMVRLTRGNVVAICVGTVVLGAVCHLDGAGATTFLICIPALLPLYQRMGMSPYLMMLLLGTSMGILNMLPWGGPVSRAGSVLKVDPVELWRGLIPAQIVAFVLLIGMAVLLGLRERRLIRKRATAPAGDGPVSGSANPGTHGDQALKAERADKVEGDEGAEEVEGAERPGRSGLTGETERPERAEVTAGVGTTGACGGTAESRESAGAGQAARGTASDDRAAPGTGTAGDGSAVEDGGAADGGASERPRRPFVNLGIVLTVLAVLVSGVLPSSYVFMLGLAVALVVNHSTVAAQMECIRSHSAGALGTGVIILAAGSFLGIMDESGMIDAMATGAVDLLPSSLVPNLHLIVGVLGLPLELLLSTDAHYFGLLPVVDNMVTAAGGDSITVANVVIVGNIIGTYISPFNASLWLGVGLAGIDIGRFIRYSVLWMWAFSLLVLGVSLAVGVL